MPVAIIGTDGYQAAALPVALNESIALNILRDKIESLGLLLTDLINQGIAQESLLTALVETTSQEFITPTIVTTSVIKIHNANAARKSIIISNNGTGDLYVRGDKSVASSGISSGIIIPSKGSFTDSGFGVYLGERWGIYSAVSSTVNVVVAEYL